MNKVIHVFLIFLFLFQEQCRLKIRGLSFCLNNLDCGLLGGLVLDKNLSLSLKIINAFYTKKIFFKCLVCAICLKKLLSKENQSRLLIGVSKIDGEFRSHAWISHKNRIIFGGISNLEDYRIIYQK